MKKKGAPIASAEEATDARVRKSMEAVLAATNQLLSESGLGGVSIEAVSRRSRVAKTTIYRHWPSRSALLLEACSKLGSRPEVPDTGSLKDDLTALAVRVAGRLKTERWASVLPSIIDAAERDPEIAAVHARLNSGFMTPFNVVIERASKRGELSNGMEPAEIVAAVVGPLFYRRWFSRETLDERFVKGVVERALRPTTAEPGRARRKRHP